MVMALINMCTVSLHRAYFPSPSRWVSGRILVVICPFSAGKPNLAAKVGVVLIRKENRLKVVRFSLHESGSALASCKWGNLLRVERHGSCAKGKRRSAMSRSDVNDELYLAAFEQRICTMRQAEQMDLEMTNLARIGARRLYYQREEAELSPESLIGLIKSWSRWQALEDATFQKDPMCVGDPLDTAHLFAENLTQHIKQLRRRLQKLTHPLEEQFIL